MPEPKTLLQMSGADPTPGALSSGSLVLIDCQCEYTDGKLPLTGVEAALSEIAGLLDRARRIGTPIIHIQHHGAPGGAFDLDGPGGQFAPQAAPIEGETIIRKKLPNSFAGTSLEETLNSIGKTEALFAGFMTHMCVSSTARAALDLGYRSTVVASAAATRDLPSPLGGIIPAGQLHENALTALADRFAIIAPTVNDLPD